MSFLEPMNSMKALWADVLSWSIFPTGEKKKYMDWWLYERRGRPSKVREGENHSVSLFAP